MPPSAKRAATPNARPAAPSAEASPTIAADGQSADGWVLAAGPWIVRAAGLWVLLGAVAKGFTGTPAELPAPILDLDIDPIAVIALAAVVETVIALVALVLPRMGAIPMAALLALFVSILLLHIRSGAESCGCFGGALPIPAWLVLVVDGALLLAVLASRPWRGARPRPAARVPLVGALALICGLALGWQADHRLAALRPAEARAAEVAATRAPQASGLPAPVPALASATPQASAPAPVNWRLPDVIPDQVLLRPIQWIGKRLADTELGRWTDTSKFPSDATVIIYYLSCNHCADHLRALADRQVATPSTSPAYVLVQLPTPSGYTGKLFVDRVPEGLRVELPAAVKTWVITPPWDVTVRNGAVVAAERIKWSGER